MGLIVIDLDINNLPLEDFMKAIGYEPIKKDGNLLIYNAPYSVGGNATMVVDTEKNGWYDSKEPEKYYSGIYDLAYELTGSCNRSELNLYIATHMKDFKEFKTYEVTVNGDEAESDVTATPISRPEQPKQQPPKPKRKMRF
ncbi:hypothetical protein [uncultured Duncaniella sp.]|jgi:hypothetical protein|uniref:hypothetical protein n=1 Tax=uncultured Duncaniella sp. TaxID=2768039 RepID=UPI00272CB64D|nr:hypothetical protein [uncultured Duncaniella sp.]